MTFGNISVAVVVTIAAVWVTSVSSAPDLSKKTQHEEQISNKRDSDSLSPLAIEMLRKLEVDLDNEIAAQSKRSNKLNTGDSLYDHAGLNLLARERVSTNNWKKRGDLNIDDDKADANNNNNNNNNKRSNKELRGEQSHPANMADNSEDKSSRSVFVKRVLEAVVDFMTSKRK